MAKIVSQILLMPSDVSGLNFLGLGPGSGLNFFPRAGRARACTLIIGPGPGSGLQFFKLGRAFGPSGFFKLH